MAGKGVMRSEIEELVRKAKEAQGKAPKRQQDETVDRKTNTIVKRLEPKKAPAQEAQAEWGDAVLDEGFTVVPNLLVDHFAEIGLNEKHFTVLVVLMHICHRKGYAYPSQRTLAQRCGFSRRTCIKVIKELKLKGYLSVYKRYNVRGQGSVRRTSNVYVMKGLLNKLTNITPGHQ